jgi:hypothetical protein
MRLMLREVEMTYNQLREETAKMPEADRLNDVELKEALDSLTKQSWLIALGQEELVTYRVNLRRKGPSSLAAGIWATLDDRMSSSNEEKGPSEEPSS